MRHNDVHPDGDQGHWAVAPSSNDVDVLVQIGEIGERRQVRLRLAPQRATHLAADLLAAAATSGMRGTFMAGDDVADWMIVRSGERARITLRDEPPFAANEIATLEMACTQVRAMAIGILEVVVRLLKTEPPLIAAPSAS